jgi:hypothetical protein
MKYLIQKQVTVTLELDENEAQSLFDLLNSGVSTDTLDGMEGLRAIHSNLGQHFKSSGLSISFATKAVKK